VRPALVHDYLLVMRGAERTFAAICECWPDAPIYALLCDRAATGRYFRGRRIETSPLQRLPVRQAGFRKLLPLYPWAVGRLPVRDHALVVSSSSAFAHGVRTQPGAVHVCYCYTPFRYAWHERERALREVPRGSRWLLAATLDRIRHWDLEAARRVTHFLAISEMTRQRIGDFYGREAAVVHPPVEVERFRPGTPEDFFLIVGELVPHKQTNLALEAVRLAGRRAVVVGEGPAAAQLRARYDDIASFRGWIPDAELADLYARTRALIVPNVEEFGIAAVEAQAAGRPVVAAGAGGAQETVLDGETGVLVPPGDADALAQAIRHTDFDAFSSQRIRAQAERFSAERFKSRFLSEVTRAAGREPAAEAAVPSSSP